MQMASLLSDYKLMISVLVVPQTEEFRPDILQEDLIYINNRLGIPNLDGRVARYAAPCWLYGDQPGVHRLYHITGSYQDGQSTVLTLGNSFVLPDAWRNMGQHRRFEYHALSGFGFVEVQPGFLLKYQV